MWHAKDETTEFLVQIEFRPIGVDALYPEGVPVAGAHIEMRAHAARFPVDGAVLTTGAESTHAFVGRFIALGSGALSVHTLAHEFGHILGFRDGYIRGYRDLGSEGFEIMEMTSTFDDIMSAPQKGLAKPTHFKLLLDNLR